MPAVVGNSEIIDSKTEIYVSGLSRLERHFAERTQLLYRSHNRTHFVPDIELWHSLAGTRAGIGHGYSHMYGIGCLLDNESGIAERSIAHTMAERPERIRIRENIVTTRTFVCAGSAVISVIGREMVVMSRLMAHTLRKRHRQMSGRIDAPEQYVGNGIALLLSRIPLHEYSGDILLLPGYGKRFACHKHENDRSTGGMNGLYKFRLCACQVQIGQVEPFAAVRARIVTCKCGAGTAAEYNSHIAAAGSFHGFGYACSVHTHQIAPACIPHISSGSCEYTAYTSQRSHSVGIVAAP